MAPYTSTSWSNKTVKRRIMTRFIMTRPLSYSRSKCIAGQAQLFPSWQCKELLTNLVSRRGESTLIPSVLLKPYGRECRDQRPIMDMPDHTSKDKTGLCNGRVNTTRQTNPQQIFTGPQTRHARTLSDLQSTAPALTSISEHRCAFEIMQA